MTTSAEALARLLAATDRAAGAFAAAEDELVADLGLSSARGRVMDLLAGAPAPLTVSQIARALGLSRQAVQRLADDLEERGLTAYSPNPGHARAHLTGLTEAGAAAYAEALRRKALWLEGLSRKLTPEWIDMAAELLTLTARRVRPKSVKTG